jgi:hypothetical protein
MTDNKKPDIIVWDEERGYYAKSLSYGTNLGAPVIKEDDIVGWKKSNVIRANKYFESKFEELKNEFQKLMDDYNWTDMIYKSKYNFEPIIGNSYHLYIDDNGETFLSIISPNEWKKEMEYVGEFKLDSKNKWEKINNI